MPNINNCVPYRAGTCSSFVSSENGCKHEAKNPDKKAIRQFKVDGEVFPKGHDPERCDWLLLDDTKGNAYYIELKGSDIPHAIEQIESTIREIHWSISEYIVFKRIVYKTGTHKIQESSVIKWKQRNKNAIIKEKQLTENI